MKMIYPAVFYLYSDGSRGYVVYNNRINQLEDILKDPYVFEFMGLPQLPVYHEGDLEEVLINNLSQFFLELGKGFTHVGRQQKFVIAGRSYKVDLVFYHRILSVLF